MGLHRRMTAWVVVSVAALGGVSGCQIISGLDGIEASASGASAGASAVAATGAGGGGAGGSGSGAGGMTSCPSGCPTESCMPTGDCTPYVVATSTLGDINYIAVDKQSGDIIWSHLGTGTGDGEIRRVSSNKQNLVINNVDPLSVAVDSGLVYWFERGGELKVIAAEDGEAVSITSEMVDSNATLIAPPPMITTTEYLFWAVPKQGWQDTASGRGWRLSLDDFMAPKITELFVDPLSNPATLAMDDGRFYWHGQGTVQWVQSISKEIHGEVATMVNETAYGIAVDSDYVYWTEAKMSGLVMRVNKGDTPSLGEKLGQESFTNPQDIAVVGNSVYVYEKGVGCGQGSKIQQINRLTGELGKEFLLAWCLSNFAQSGTSLYWAVGSEIYRLVTSEPVP